MHLWMKWLLGILLVMSTAVKADAIHQGGVPICADGEVGYLATLLAEQNRVYTFLSKEDPPSSETIVCQLGPQQLVQVKGAPKGL